MHKQICKRLVCLIISVLMIAALLPTGVFADASSYKYFYVNGVDILTATGNTVQCGSGTAELDLDTNTLTLTNATITTLASYSSNYLAGIYVAATSATAIPNGLTINLVGDNTITGTGNSTKEYGIYFTNIGGNLVGVNGGTLTLDSVYNGVYFSTSSLSYSISNCTVTATGIGNNPIYATGTTSISSSTINVSNSVRGIYATGALTISKSTVTLNTTATNAYGGLYSTNSKGGLTIEDSTVNTTCTGGKNALYARYLTVSGNSNITATGGYSTGNGYGYINIYPTSGDEISILVGSSANSTTVYGTYDEDTSITTGYTELMYTTYPYFAITTSVGTGTKTYKVSVSDSDNGSVTASQTTKIEAGSTVTLTVEADTNYQLDTLVVTDASGNEVTLTDNGDGTYSFTMPESNVTVTATFCYEDGILYIFTSGDTYYFNFSDYLTDYSAGDKLKITATFSGNSAYDGALGADDVDGVWTQTYYDSNSNTVTLIVTASDDYPDGTGQFQCYGIYWGDGFQLNSISIVNLSKANSSTTGTIYVNEQYHGIFINGHLACIPHTVDEYGYCTVCKEYIGLESDETDKTEAEAEVTEETVEIAEPTENTETETEDDGEEETLEVTDEAVESNPTTGAILALVPMAVAGLAVAITKRR